MSAPQCSAVNHGHGSLTQRHPTIVGPFGAAIETDPINKAFCRRYRIATDVWRNAIATVCDFLTQHDRTAPVSRIAKRLRDGGDWASNWACYQRVSCANRRANSTSDTEPARLLVKKLRHHSPHRSFERSKGALAQNSPSVSANGIRRLPQPHRDRRSIRFKTQQFAGQLVVAF